MSQADTYSPRTVRVILGLVALAFAATAALLVDGWPRWLFAALTVITVCAVVTPPFRRPAP